MKNLKLQLCAFILLFCVLFGVTHANITDTKTYSTTDFDSSIVVAPDSESYVKITPDLPNSIVLDEEGYPELPAFTYLYSLPEEEQVDSVVISSSSSSTLFALTELVYPAQSPVLTRIGAEDPDFVPPGDFYDSTIYPLNSQLAGCSDPVSFAFGMGIATIYIRPVQYLISSDTVKLYTSISFTIYTSTSAKTGRVANQRSTFAQDYIVNYLKGIVENPNSVESNLPEPPTISDYNPPTYPPIPPDYIIVTDEDLVSSATPFRNWLRLKGIPTDIYSLEDIYDSYSGDDNAEELRNFIIDMYDDGVLYVLLIGNLDVVPVRYVYYANTSTTPDLIDQEICDLYYADVDGNWDYDNDGVYGEPDDDQPDIHADIQVGRVATEDSPSEVSEWVAKTIAYEDTNFSCSGYLSNVVISSADRMADGTWPQQIGSAFSNFFDIDTETLREYPSGSDPNPTSPSGQDVEDYLGDTPVNYFISLNHGSPDLFAAKSSGFNVSNRSCYACSSYTYNDWGYVGDVECGDCLYIHSSIACDIGALDGNDANVWGIHFPDCMAEEDLILTGGEVAGTYNTRQGWYPPSCRIEQKRTELLCGELYEHKLAPSHYAAKGFYNYPGIYRQILYSNSFFGDPNLAVWTHDPGSFVFELPDSAFRDILDTLTVKVKDSVSQSVLPGVLVTLSKGDEVYSRDVTDITGRAYLPVKPDTDGDLVVGAKRSNYYSKFDTIDVVTYCDDAVAGDANGSGGCNGLDVIYLNSYLHGGANPPDSCMCVDEDFLYHAADANGSCTVNGLDVTYLTNYFQGGSAPVFCSSCPGSTLLLSKPENITASPKN